MKTKHTYLFFVFFLSSQLLFSQIDSRVWYDGNSRAMFYRDALAGDLKKSDTTSARSNGEGYTAIDLGIHFNPSKEIEIFSEIRIKNDFGYMWGSGAYVDLRRLSVRGILNDRVSFNLGDIYLKQTEFTLYNNDQELSKYESSVFQSYNDLINYENFYEENYWRTQGVQSNFSYTFYNAIKSLELDGFASRVRGNQWLGKPELLMLGGSSILRLENNIKLAGHYINSFEVQSTSNDSAVYKNPVFNIQASYYKKINNRTYSMKIEGGSSLRSWEKTNGSQQSIEKSQGGYFKFFSKARTKKSAIDLCFKYVDPNFRSAGAQTRRVIYESSPSSYPYFTNNTVLRPVSLMDITTDPNIYNQRLSTVLMNFNPQYGAVNPYGEATPNRAGVSGGYKYSGDFLTGKIKLNLLSEIIGQGTTNKRSLLSLGTSVVVRLDKVLKTKNKLNFEISSYLENVSRDGNSIEEIDFHSRLLSAGLSYELFENLKLISGIKTFVSIGNEVGTERDEYDKIIGYSLFNFDSEESIQLIGLQYNFTDDIYFSLQTNNINFVDKMSLDKELKLTRIYFMFNMNL